MFRVPGGIIHHGIQVMLIPLEECVLEAMVEGLGMTFELGPAYPSTFEILPIRQNFT